MMLSRNSLYGAMVLTAFLASSALARDYYVDNRRGNDANEGLSSSCPLETLAAATAKLGPGDVLHVAPGAKYRESLRISRGGTAAAPIVVKGGGAVLCGLSAFPKDGWEAKGDGLFFLKCGGCWGALCPRVFLGEERMLSVACVWYDIACSLNRNGVRG